MKLTKQTMAEELQEDVDLLKLLASNPPFNDSSGTATKAHSVIPAGKATASTNTPFLTLQGGTEALTGVKLTEEVFYIRCYNRKDQSYVSIDQILEMVKEIMNDKVFLMSGIQNVKTKYEQTGPELEDQSIGFNFRESRYRLFLL